MRQRKGQLVFEFIIAAIVFVGIVVFVLNILSTNVSTFNQDYESSNLESKAIAASEALLKTPSGIGIAESWPVLKYDSVDAFNATCNQTAGTYTEILTGLNLVDAPGFGAYRVTVDGKTALTGRGILHCRPPSGPAIPENVTAATVERFAILNGELVALNVWVWLGGPLAR